METLRAQLGLRHGSRGLTPGVKETVTTGSAVNFDSCCAFTMRCRWTWARWVKRGKDGKGKYHKKSWCDSSECFNCGKTGRAKKIMAGRQEAAQQTTAGKVAHSVKVAREPGGRHGEGTGPTSWTCGGKGDIGRDLPGCSQQEARELFALELFITCLNLLPANSSGSSSNWHTHTHTLYQSCESHTKRRQQCAARAQKNALRDPLKRPMELEGTLKCRHQLGGGADR